MLIIQFYGPEPGITAEKLDEEAANIKNSSETPDRQVEVKEEEPDENGDIGSESVSNWA